MMWPCECAMCQAQQARAQSGQPYTVPAVYWPPSVNVHVDYMPRIVELLTDIRAELDEIRQALKK